MDYRERKYYLVKRYSWIDTNVVMNLLKNIDSIKIHLQKHEYGKLYTYIKISFKVEDEYKLDKVRKELDERFVTYIHFRELKSEENKSDV